MIVPCGIPDKQVTSIKNELNKEIDFLTIKNCLINEICTTFELYKI